MVIREVKLNPPDLIILDIMLPGKDGMTICSEILAFSKVPILILTAKMEEIDRIRGLELGADDYMCKPFSPREVVARVKAILRRATPSYEQTENKISVGPITIHRESYNVTIEKIKLHLTPHEFELLKLMANHPNYVFSRGDLLSSLQGDDNFDSSERIIASHIKNLRKKMDEVLPDNNLIQTVYGVGYLLCITKSDINP